MFARILPPRVTNFGSFGRNLHKTGLSSARFSTHFPQFNQFSTKPVKFSVNKSFASAPFAKGPRGCGTSLSVPSPSFSASSLLSSLSFITSLPFSTCFLSSKVSPLILISPIKTPFSFLLPRKMTTTSTTPQRTKRDLYQKHIFHYSSLCLAILTPIAIFGPGIIRFVTDLGLALIIPLHGYLGTRLVIQDYLPAHYSILNVLLIALCLLIAFGLIRLTLQGRGIISSTKDLFRNKKDEPKQH